MLTLILKRCKNGESQLNDHRFKLHLEIYRKKTNLEDGLTCLKLTELVKVL